MNSTTKCWFILYYMWWTNSSLHRKVFSHYRERVHHARYIVKIWSIGQSLLVWIGARLPINFLIILVRVYRIGLQHCVHVWVFESVRPSSFSQSCLYCAALCFYNLLGSAILMKDSIAINFLKPHAAKDEYVPLGT